LVFIDYKEMKKSLSNIFEKIAENSIKTVSFDSEKEGFQRGHITDLALAEEFLKRLVKLSINGDVSPSLTSVKICSQNKKIREKQKNFLMEL
jgi:hypothetical protein